MADVFIREYEGALDEVGVVPQKHVVNALSMLAEDNSLYAAEIVECFHRKIRSVSPIWFDCALPSVIRIAQGLRSEEFLGALGIRRVERGKIYTAGRL
jgi:hypothetical protein